jgi:hypothetical protein
MESRWDYSNFDHDTWNEYGMNDLTLEVRKMVHGEVPVDLWAIYLLVHDLEFRHMSIDALRRRLFRARLRRLFRIKGEK